MKNSPELISSEYLCQVNESVSCGACCGLYNVPDASFETLKSRLTHRTRLYDSIPNHIDAVEAFKEGIEAMEIQEGRPINDFHHCPYIGLVGENRLRVGCLLHPLNPKNNHFDYRGLSFYGGMTCRVYFCPSATKLPGTYAEIVKSLADDWYGYGLIITETRLLTAFFGEIERRLQKPLKARAILSNPSASDAIRKFFSLKIKWPFRKKGHAYLGNYFFNDNLCPKPKPDYAAINQPVSRYHILLEELASEFDTSSSLLSAEDMLEGIFSQITTALK